MHILNKLNRQLHVYIPVSLRRSIAADNSLTHPRNADGEDVLNEAADLLFLPPDPFVISRDVDDELWLLTGLVIELIDGELLASGKKIEDWISNTNDYYQKEKRFMVNGNENLRVVTFLVPVDLFIVPNTYRNRVV